MNVSKLPGDYGAQTRADKGDSGANEIRALPNM